MGTELAWKEIAPLSKASETRTIYVTRVRNGTHLVFLFLILIMIF